VNPVLQAEERLKQVDREVVDLQHGFVDAIAHLKGAPEVDGTFEERWARIAERLRNLRSGLFPEDFDKQQLTDVYTTLLDIRDLVDRIDGSRDMEAFDQLLIHLERIRHVVRDALDEHVTGAGRDVGLVMEDLDRWLPNTPRHALAELVGVDRRTHRPRRDLGGRTPLALLAARTIDEDALLAAARAGRSQYAA
jgi:hypothetical protein